MPWDWNAWPARALDEIQDMFVRSVIDSIRRLEEGDARATQLHLGAGASRFWVTRHRRSGEQAFRNSNVGEIDRLYGLRVVHDRILDRTISTGDFRSEMRVVSDGGGSESIEMRAEDHPERLSYQVEFRTRLGESRSRRFSYALIDRQLHEDGRPMTTAELNRPRPLPSEERAAAAAAMVADQQNRIAEARASKPVVRREMSELMIAWNS